MNHLDYLEGKYLTIERRSAEGEGHRLPSLAADLVRMNLDLIVTARNVVRLLAGSAGYSDRIIDTQVDDRRTPTTELRRVFSVFCVGQRMAEANRQFQKITD